MLFTLRGFYRRLQKLSLWFENLVRLLNEFNADAGKIIVFLIDGHVKE